MKNLFRSITRLLEYSGSKVASVSQTKDGIVFDIVVEGESLRVFVTKPGQVLPFKKRELEYLEA
jgi:hypothetical protein